MKNILCFGDSNTFGFNPHNGRRYRSNERWSGILKEELKDRFNIIEAGCNNRTCFIDNPQGIEQTGYKILPKYLTNDIDIILVALGVNDLQFLYNPTVEDIKSGITKMINLVRKIKTNIKIIIVNPSEIDNSVLNNDFFSKLFDESSIEKSKEISKIYFKVASKLNCEFVDLNKITNVCKIDGLHYEIEGHVKIANYLKKLLLNIET